MDKLMTQPPKGTSDWWPQEYKIRKYIFDTWRRVCESYGYEEYLTPLVELADVYRAKSGEDVGGKELTIFEDRGGRELAIRPEMTPSVTRMVADRYNGLPKPIRLFSIANFFRNEKPQKGRNREFWQLNFDIFGADSMQADAEIIKMAIEIMIEFGADQHQFQVFINDRRLIDSFVTKYLSIPSENRDQAVRLLDKFAKLERVDFMKELTSLGAKIPDQGLLFDFLSMDEAILDVMMKEVIPEWDGYENMKLIAETLSRAGYESYGRYNPSMVRGFDYYDGMVFEVFDAEQYYKSLMGEGSARSLFGGGRYNGLAGIFGMDSFPAVGCAPGDETTRIFLEEKGLIPAELEQRSGYYLPLIDENVERKVLDQLANKLRAEGKKVIQGLELEKFGKALGNADKLNAKYAIILGERELAEGNYSVKDLESGEQELIPLSQN